MTLSEAEKEYHVESSKFDMLMRRRREINEAVEKQHDRKLQAHARLKKLRGSER